MNLTSRWPTWRRDLVAGLIGAVLAVALVGGAVYYLWVQAENARTEAEAAKREAAEFRTKVEKHDAQLRAVNDALAAEARFHVEMMRLETNRFKDLVERETDPERKKLFQEWLFGPEKQKKP